MRQRYIKIVKGKSGRQSYYLGDGFWFGRVSEKKALDGLASGEFGYWETVDHSDDCAPVIMVQGSGFVSMETYKN